MTMMTRQELNQVATTPHFCFGSFFGLGPGVLSHSFYAFHSVFLLIFVSSLSYNLVINSNKIIS